MWTLMKNLLAAVILLPLLFVSCTSVVDGVFFDEREQVALNCVLNTASDTVTAWLTHTAPLIGKNSFKPVSGASIRLQENGQWVGSFTHTDSSVYILPYNVKPGATYKIEASTSNKILWAETRVPLSLIPKLDTVKHFFGNELLYTIAFNLKFDDNHLEKNYYWIVMQKTWEYGQADDDIRNETVYSNTLLADDFNRFIEDYNGFRFSYGNFMRLDDILFSGQTCDITFGGIGYSVNKLNKKYRIFFLHVDRHFDRYLKTALVRREMDAMSEDFPIYYSPFAVYSKKYLWFWVSPTC